MAREKILVLMGSCSRFSMTGVGFEMSRGMIKDGSGARPLMVMFGSRVCKVV